MAVRPYLHHRPQIAAGVWIDPAATVIGQVEIGENSSVWPGCVLRGDVNRIQIGRDCNIQDGSILHVTHVSDYDPAGGPLILGNGITVGHGAILHACTLSDYCLIGMGATVLDHAVIEAYAMIGAGALVPPGKRVKSGELWLGNPARKARELTDSERQYLEYSAAHYVKLKNAYLHSH
jgi:carbonic anhydrase/acetyltransferase-like protein (isoleucine patch superfamily)